ncbi:MAG: DUF4197 domain-containing protein [Bacteroidia bacterium]
MRYLLVATLGLIWAQTWWENLLGKNTTPSLSQEQSAQAIRQALQIATDTAVKSLSQANGYFRDITIRILLPPQVQKIEKMLRSLPQGAELVDKLILQLNRAAENAVSQARPIFLQAIEKLTLQDAIKIVQGADDAATQYLKSQTQEALFRAYKPKIQKALEETGAQQTWQTLASRYNKLPAALRNQTIPEDLADHTTHKALQGLFVRIAQHEARIRKDARYQVTDLLQRVFGKK